MTEGRMTMKRNSVLSRQRGVGKNSYLPFLQIVIKFNNRRIIKFASLCDLQDSCRINRFSFGDALQLETIFYGQSISEDMELLN